MIRALLGLLLLMVWQSWAVAPALRVERFGNEDGLPQSSIVKIVQDQQGFIWVGTMYGLSRFDGYRFKSFFHDENDLSSLSGNYISSLLVDNDGFVWVGTQFSGLSRFDPQTGLFKRFTPHIAAKNGLLSNVVLSLALGQNNQIWIGSDKGLSRYDSHSGLFTHFTHQNTNGIMPDSRIHHVLMDSQQRLWLVFDRGIGYFDVANNQFYPVKALDQLLRDKRGSTIGRLFEDSQQRLWFGYRRGDLLQLDGQSLEIKVFNVTLANENKKFYAANISEDAMGHLWLTSVEDGLRRFNVKTGEILKFQHDDSDVTSISDNRIYDLFKDSQGVHWLGTKFGLNKVDFSLLKLGHYKASNLIEQSMSQSIVMSITKDKRGVLWLGTDGGGVNYQTSRYGPFSHLRHDKNNVNSLSHDVVLHVLPTDSGVMWFGTLQGLNRYDPQSGKFTHFLHQPNLVAHLREMQVIRLLSCDDGFLWLGTGAGLLKFNPETGEVERIKVDDEDIGLIYALALDNQGQLWVGTQRDGLIRIDTNTMKMTRYRHDIHVAGSLGHDSILSLYVDSQGVVWAGTFAGLNRYDALRDDFTVFNKNNGLLDELIYGITEDKEGQLWVSTNKGLAKFNEQKQQFTNYQVYDGLQSNEFNVYATFTADDGELFFGGVNGFNRFYPHQLQRKVKPPQVLMTDFLLENQSVHFDKTIETLTEIQLDSIHQLLAFEFAAADYHFPQLNRFKYRLQGFDQDWIYTDANNRRATYTNLPAGDYVFEVAAANRHLQWSTNNKQIKLVVIAPLYLSWWAKLLYVLLGLLMFWWLYIYFLQRSKMRQQQEMMAHLEKVDKLKDSFLATTSHELRSPLNGIIGMSEALLNGSGGELSDKAKDQIFAVVACGRRLTHLINDILDMSKLKHGQIRLNITKVNLHLICQNVIEQTKFLVADKDILLTNLVDPQFAAVNADEQRVSQVIFNLVSNAIKFTQSGTVTIDARASRDGVEIRVIDTGVGINAQSLTKIFDPFDMQSKREEQLEGTGLGLTISRQLIELHGGELVVSSELNQGSCFKFTLPNKLPSAALEVSSQADCEAGRQSMNLARMSAGEENAVTFNQLALSDFDGSQFRLLLVDDEAINMKVLSKHLALHKYQISMASSGSQALEAIEQQGPFDLVLLDILMPQMSGFELCRKIRERFTMSQLPVIFLTASHDQQDVIKGLLAGGNDHLCKPVDQYELLARVSTHIKLLDIRRNLERKVAERSEQIVAAQQKLVFTEKLASLGTLMAGVAHEINNPINFIALAVANLKTELNRCKSELVTLAGGDDAPAEVLTMLDDNFAPLYEQLITIDDGTDRVRTIVKDLKSASYMDVSSRSSVDLVASLNSNINLIASEYGTKVQFQRDFKPLPKLSCYIAKLNQVFMNIMVNACDAIDVKIERDSHFIGELTVRSYVEEQWIVIEFSDNGCGMDEKIKKRLFDPFFTTKGFEKGTGLGLSISIDIIRSHQGQLLVESELNIGTTFTVKLPIQAAHS